MKRLKLVVSILFFLLVLSYALAFAAHNSTNLTVDFLAGLKVSLPAALWIGLFVTLGGVIAWFFTGVASVRQRLRISRLEKELEESKRRLGKMS